jgi:hypothetical protein
MAIIRGPKIVRNGLVLALDAGDRNSYSGSGTTWYDLSGNANNGTLTNGPTFSAVNGGCIVFDGVDDYVNVSDASTLNSNTQTINIWYNATTLPGRSATIICKHNTVNSTNGYNIFAGNSVQIKPSTGSTDIGTSGGVVSTWYFLTLTFTINSSATLYINAVNNASAAIGNFTMSSNSLRIGRSPDSFWSVFTGKIASVSVYNRVLSASEISQNYNATKSRFGL